MRKLLTLVLLLFAFVSLASAYDIDFPDQTATYGEDATITLECNSGDCPEPSSSYGGGSPGMSLDIVGCRALQNFDFTYDNGNTMSVTYHIPREYVCGLGDHEMRVTYEGETEATATLTVTETGTINPNKARNLLVNVDIGNNDLRNFQLTDGMWDVSPQPSSQSGNVLVQYYDNNYIGNNHQRAYKTITPGADPIMSGTSIQDFLSFNNVIASSSTSSSDTDEVLEKDFTTGNTWDYGDVEGAWGIGTQSPLHLDGDYIPDGELAIGYEPQTSAAYNDYDSFSPSSDESQVVRDLSTGIYLEPTQVNNDVSLQWDTGISRGAEKTVTYTMNFDKKGHTRIEYRNTEGLVANFNTDARGTNDIWFYCYTCDDSMFETTTSTDGYGELPVDYQTGKNYEFEATRTNGDLEFAIREDGTEIWSHTESNINDFGYTNLETWETWSEGDTTKPEYGLHGMEITGDPQGPYFYTCRDGATMSNGVGDEVPIVMQANDQLYQCDWSISRTGNKYGFEWVEVNECGDGLDNDGDGTVDHPDSDVSTSASSDSGCSSVDDTEGGSIGSAEDGDCTPAVSYNGSHYVAYYGGNPDGSSEGYCDGSGGNRETFSEWTESLTGGSAGSPPSPNLYVCDETEQDQYSEFTDIETYCDYRSYDSHDDNTSKSGSQINYVAYYPTEDYLANIIDRTYQHDFNMYIGEKTASHFVNQYGWTRARMALDDSSSSGDGLKPSSRQGAEHLYGPTGDSHDESHWFNTLGLVDGDGNGYVDGSYNDSWTVANAGAPDNDRVSSEFPGGWAGKCPEGTEWKKEAGEWTCSGQPDWQQAVFLPEITEDSDTIGMMVMPYNFRDETPNAVDTLGLKSWKTAYDDVPDNSVSSNQDLDTMEVTCYSGETKGESNYFTETVDIPGTDIDNPIGVYGEVDMSNAENYTCEWEYTTVGGEINPSGIGEVVELQKTDTDEQRRDHYFGDEDEGIDPKVFAEGTYLEEKKYSAKAFKTLVDTNREAEGLTALS